MRGLFSTGACGFADHRYCQNDQYPTCAEGFDPFGDEEIDPDEGKDDFTGWPDGEEPDEEDDYESDDDYDSSDW